MNPFRFRFSLRLRHPKMDPEAISIGLGMRPRFKWEAGEIRSTPDGKRLTGVHSHTYWCSEGVEGKGFHLAEALSAHLFTLEAREPFLQDFVATGGSIEYFIAWFTDGLNTGATIDCELLKRLSSLQIDLGLDVYGGKNPSRECSTDDEDHPG